MTSTPTTADNDQSQARRPSTVGQTGNDDQGAAQGVSAQTQTDLPHTPSTTTTGTSTPLSRVPSGEEKLMQSLPSKKMWRGN